MKISLTKSMVPTGSIKMAVIGFVLITFAGSAFAKKAVSVQSGNWGDSAVWSFTGGIDSAHHADTVLINPGHTITFLGIYRSTTIVFMRIFTNGVLSPMGNNSEMILADSNAIFQLDSGAFLRNNSGNNSNHSFQIGNQGIWGRKTCNNNAMTGLSQFTKATPCGGWAALPVKLNGFAASIHRDGLNVSWTTGMESNCSHYDVQVSADGMVYESIGRVRAKAEGNANDLRHYNFTVNGFSPDAHATYLFVRLQQTDLDGIQVILGTMPVRISDKTEPFVFNSGSAVLSLNAGLTYNSFQIYGPGGQKVLSSDIHPEYGQSFEMGGLASGIYIIAFFQEGSPVYRQRFCVRN